MTEVYSFDIFDTLITRKTGMPKGVFIVMQEEIKNNPDFSHIVPFFLQRDFSQVRIDSEEESRLKEFSQNGTYEITLADIYNCLAKRFHLSCEVSKKIFDLEIETEKKELIAISQNIELVKDLKKAGKRVILISDMYLPSSVISDIMINIDSVFKDMPIYVSGDIKKSKHKGDLFPYVCQKENIPLNELNHYGDNEHSDYRVPKSLGVSVKDVFTLSSASPYEKIFLVPPYDNNLYIQRITGVSQLLRLSSSNQTPQEELGNSFAGPFFYAFTDWVLEQSLQDGVEHIYFCARDGYILKDIADIIIKERNLSLKAHYLYVSRQASWGTSVDLPLVYSEQLLSLYNEKPDEKLEDFLSILGLSDIDKERMIDFWQKHSSKITLSSFFDKVFSLYKDVINANLQERLTLFLGYLEQEGVFKEKVALVDVGWSGTIQDVIFSLRKSFTSTNLYGYYVALNQFIANSMFSQNIKKPFLFLSRYEMVNKNYSFVLMIESLATAPHGGLLGYSKKNDMIIPILKKETNKPLLNWGAESYWSGIKNFSKVLVSFPNISNLQKYHNYIFFCEKFLSAFEKPFPKLATILGAIPYTGKVSHDGNTVLSPPFRKISYFQYCLSRIFHKNLSEVRNIDPFTFWNAGSKSQSSFSTLIFISFMKKLYTLSSFILKETKKIFILLKKNN